MKRNHIAIGLILTLLLLFVHILVIDEYGVTWDFHHHFFAGLFHLNIPIDETFTKDIPFTVPDPRTTNELPFGPIMTIIPAASEVLFAEKLGILAPDNAYHLAVILQSVAGIFVLYLFLLEAFGLPTALIGFVFLGLLPRYWGDLHNNMKDVPQAAAFALAIWTFWRLAKYKRLKDLLVASAAFAIAFNMKVNALFVPLIAGVWLLFNKISAYVPLSSRDPASRRGEAISRRLLRHFVPRNDRLVLAYFFLAPLAAFLLWMPFWAHPVERLLYMFRFFQDNTKFQEVLYFGTIYKSGVTVPWHYPFGYLAVTTPIPILLFFLMGLMRLMRHMRKNQNGLLLILWFFLPLARYLNPNIGVIDGIRHFEEVVFPLSAIAAVGYTTFVRRIPFVAKIALSLFVIWHLSFSIFSYHPYQISYYNELVGGLRGAQGKFDVEYWGTSQKAAIRWLNKNAAQDAWVNIVMATESAATYLRPDLLARANKKSFWDADWVVVLNRQSYFGRYGLPAYLTSHKPIYSVEAVGIPLVFVYRNSP